MAEIKLTKQQERALNLLGDGRNYKEIALTLNVSYSRVINILNEILLKTGLKSKRELIANAKTLEYDVI